MQKKPTLTKKYEVTVINATLLRTAGKWPAGTPIHFRSSKNLSQLGDGLIGASHRSVSLGNDKYAHSGNFIGMYGALDLQIGAIILPMGLARYFRS